MWLFSLLRNRTSNSAARAKSQCRPPAPRLRPQLEVLEDRCVPSTLTVTNNLDNGSVGSLRYEIGKAHQGDTIVFAPSLDGQTITLGGSELDITKSLTIQGPGPGLLRIDGFGLGELFYGSRVFQVEKKTNVTLSGLTIWDGAGIASQGFVDPNDGKGGGILNFGTLTISGCSVTGNFAVLLYGNEYGGGIYNAGTLTVAGSTVSGNSAAPYPDMGAGYGYGGGIYNAGTLTVMGSTVPYNSASTEGGGIYNAGTATLSNSTLSGNFAGVFGGGIYNASRLTVSGSAVSNNYAQFGGGGIYNAGTMTVSGCTVSSNSIDQLDRGAGIYNAGTLTVSNSAFSGNFEFSSLDNIFGPYTDGGGNSFS
jgi:hypothetical protein